MRSNCRTSYTADVQGDRNTSDERNISCAKLAASYVRPSTLRHDESTGDEHKLRALKFPYVSCGRKGILPAVPVSAVAAKADGASYWVDVANGDECKLRALKLPHIACGRVGAKPADPVSAVDVVATKAEKYESEMSACLMCSKCARFMRSKRLCQLSPPAPRICMRQR